MFTSLLFLLKNSSSRKTMTLLTIVQPCRTTGNSSTKRSFLDTHERGIKIDFKEPISPTTATRTMAENK